MYRGGFAGGSGAAKRSSSDEGPSCVDARTVQDVKVLNVNDDVQQVGK